MISDILLEILLISFYGLCILGLWLTFISSIVSGIRKVMKSKKKKEYIQKPDKNDKLEFLP